MHTLKNAEDRCFLGIKSMLLSALELQHVYSPDAGFFMRNYLHRIRQTSFSAIDSDGVTNDKVFPARSSISRSPPYINKR